MSNSIIDRKIGVVDSVSTSEIKGFLLDEAPKNISILEGNITYFPRINSYLVIPNETGWLVGMISWIGYNHAVTSDEVNLPQGKRMIYLNVMGHIVETLHGLEFERGAFSLPTVGDSILIPTIEQMNAVVRNDDKNVITIGTSPLAGNQEIKLSIDSLFGRHLAILGNTGSGKSCTVAGIIRWSIEESIKEAGKSPNARIIILDPNVAYRHTFDDLNMDVFYCAVKADDLEQNVEQLRAPAWMWTSKEWSSILQASGKTQKPILREALRNLKSSNININAEKNKDIISEDLLRAHLHNFYNFLTDSIVNEEYLNREYRTKFGKQLDERLTNMKIIVSRLGEEFLFKTESQVLVEKVESVLKNKRGEYNGNVYYNAFNLQDIDDIRKQLQDLIDKLGKPSEKYLCNEDDPVEFEIEKLPSFIQVMAQDSAASQYVEFMTIRIEALLKNSNIMSVVGSEPHISLLDWINQYLGNKDEKGKICVIDLSIVPAEIVHLVVAVVARLIFEAMQRYRKHYGQELPTLMVMEEAHTFIKKYSDDSGDYSSNELCSKIFEKIAREGRKFGLGLVISSQRPSELSPTVLSQCNSYILHRIVNDKDQEMVKRLVPDTLGKLLDELPSLPTKKAIVLGAAVPIPTVVDIKDLPYGKRPKSDNPEFWRVWTRKNNRSTSWNEVVENWTNI